MSGVHESRQHIDAFFDDELTGAERDSLIAHCRTCETCRAMLERRRTLLEAIRSARLPVKAPPGLRDKVTALLETEHSAQSNPSSPGRRGTASPRGWLLRAMVPSSGYAIILLMLAGLGTSFFLWQREARMASFVQMAIETHRHQLQGSLPIQFTSASAREITGWFGSRLPFSLRLPAYQDDSGDHSSYQIKGASLTSFEGQAAAYIAYRMRSELISLIVVSADQVVASGGETTRAKGIVFHSAQQNDLQAITWSVHHLTYALVSNVKLPRRQSCVVCHSDPKGHDLLKSDRTHHSVSYYRSPSAVSLWTEQSALTPFLYK